jgi:hypothetical protein
VSAPRVIRVTAGHITRGVPQNCGRCPIALAIRDAWGLSTVEVIADINELIVYPGGLFFRTETPSDVAAFMNAYDNDGPDYVAPFEFAVEWIDQDGAGA